eukprot:235978_1
MITPSGQYNAVLVAWFGHTIELPQYLEVFVDHGYDDVLMLELIEDKAQLIEMGIVNRQHQALIMSEIKKLRPVHVVQGRKGENSVCLPAHRIKDDRTVEGERITAGITVMAAVPHAETKGNQLRGRCTDCGKQDFGKIYDEDELFYCNQCWMAYDETTDAGV